MMDAPKNQTPETDSVPRISARDLFMVLQLFERRPETTLEEIRLRICVDREKQRRGTFLWSAARDASGELVKLDLIEGACYARNARQYESMKANRLRVTPEGTGLLKSFRTDRGAAYDDLFRRLVAQHLYVREFIRTVNRVDVVAPVISSMRDHVAARYSSHTVLASDLAASRFETKALLGRLAERIRRPLRAEEEEEIRENVGKMAAEARRSALADDGARLTKLVLNRLNDVVIPALFRGEGLGFDFRSHRALWSLGEDFKTWATVRSHPQYDAWLVYRTATVELAEDGAQLGRLVFDHGVQRTRDGFMGKLYAAYQKLQAVKGNTFVPAWELRAVFCHDHRCQLSVFDALFDQAYAGSDEFKLQLEIQRQKPQHEAPVRAGNRNIGAVRVVKR
jgi:hypothetical protein